MVQLKMRTKLLVSFFVVALGSAVVGGFGMFATGKLISANGELASKRLPSSGALAHFHEALADMRFNTAKAVAVTLEGRDEKTPALWTNREEARKRAEDGLALYDGLPRSPEEQVLWDQIVPAFRAYVTDSGKMWDAIRAHDSNQANNVEDGFLARMQSDLVEPLRKLVELQRTIGEKVTSESQSTARTTRHLLWSVMVVTLALAMAFGSFLALSVSRPLAFLVAEARRLREAVDRGELHDRGDATRVAMEFRPIVEGMNQMMDAFVKPIQVTADYVDRIARGDVPQKITDRYEGDFDRIKQNLNTCIDALHALTADATALSQAAVEGRLSARADVSKHQGDYARIVAGVNATLDAVMKPIDEATMVLEKLARRDLKARVRGSYRGDHARIKDALNATAEALHESMAQVAQAVEQVSSAAGQIASSSQAVADGASEHASSIEETNSSLESMASTTRHAADYAQQAKGLSLQAKSAAVEGSAAMVQMTGAMGKIKASAEGTSQIIKDINEIAFQTNLLALNAAVEAARAGDAGRGFAVVAEEVRSLALRSKEAATKTEELIRQSVNEACDGEVTAKHVNGKLGEIAGSATKASDIVAEIAASAKEQAVGIEQLTRAMAQMSQVTQQNAASSEESSSAAAELSGQSEELAAMVSTFQLERVAAAPAKLAAAPHPATSSAAGTRPEAARARDGHANGKNGATPARSPEQIIPLGADPLFRDF